MLSDIEIAQKNTMNEINEVALSAGIPVDKLELYGNYKAKIDQLLQPKEESKLILVTAMSPTPLGEGKTTVSIGLADSIRAYFKNSKLDKKVMLALREPSLGPVFGIKGGACGGGYSQVVPMEDINLHFTGDLHAITSANNLLAAMLDNHIMQGNELNIDIESISWRRCLDMNDRQLRFIKSGLGGGKNGVPRDDGFDITAASEVMAVFCLSSDLQDLKKRLGNIIVGTTKDGKPVTAHDLKAEGAMTVLLKDAFKPNLVQTLEGTPALVHGGPFANIAHGCNTVVATKTALSYADYVVTEAGFGADLGAEKFLDIKCRVSGLQPACVVMVATIRALKLHGGAGAGLKGNELKEELKNQDLNALEQGLPNLLRHVNNIKEVYKLPCVVVVNKFPTDTDQEIDLIIDLLKKYDIKVCVSEACLQGSKGGSDMAECVVAECEKNTPCMNYSYDIELSLEEKLNQLAKNIYGASKVEFVEKAPQQLNIIKNLGYDKLPVCVAKTQYSFSDDASIKNAPKDFTLHVKSLKVSGGAGFIVAQTGSIMTMPGLSKHPAAEYIDINSNGSVTGLF